MAQCSAITNALASKGFDNDALAGKSGLTSQRVNAILSGNAKPTTDEFNSIADALGLSHAPEHAAKVTI